MPYFVKHSKQKNYGEMGVTLTCLSSCLLHHPHSLSFYLLGYVGNKLSPLCFLPFPCIFVRFYVYLMFRKCRLSLSAFFNIVQIQSFSGCWSTLWPIKIYLCSSDENLMCTQVKWRELAIPAEVNGAIYFLLQMMSKYSIL